LILGLDCPGSARGPADIEIVDGRIARIGPTAGLEAETRRDPGTPPGRVIDGAGLVASKGLVNAHLHSSGHFSRGSLDNLPLELFMLWELPPLRPGPHHPSCTGPRALLGAVEMRSPE
jgi:cytosine/adenosine deaminase-related metal-dependent hydrolase